MLAIRRLNKRGDTIVEVMIALAVLGLAVSISYATANRSLLNARQAQENAAATELVQSQLETLRSKTGINDPSDNFYIFQTSDFCVANDGSGIVSVNTPPTPPATTSPCNYDTYYNIDIHYSPTSAGSPSQGGTFTATVSWDDVTGQGTDHVYLSYRLYPT